MNRKNSANVAVNIWPVKLSSSPGGVYCSVPLHRRYPAAATHPTCSAHRMYGMSRNSDGHSLHKSPGGPLAGLNFLRMSAFQKMSEKHADKRTMDMDASAAIG